MRSPRHVVVTSDQSLVADTVSAALTAPDLRVTRLQWTSDPEGRAPELPDEPFQVGVMLCELQPVTRLAEVTRLMRAVPTDWVVLTVVPEGPLWGALLDGGAAAVLPSACSLDELRSAIGRVAAGEKLMSGSVVHDLRTSWSEVELERTRAVGSLRSLSPREAEVLDLLYAGESVSGIAERFGLREATVRSHVRAVLRKLKVRSQLEAVAAYQLASDWEPDG